MNSISVTVQSNVRQAVPFFRVKNIEDSVRWYVEGVGFEMKQNWVEDGKVRWCWLQYGGGALMLQEWNPSRPPDGKVGVGVSICFQCEDALAIYREVTARGLKASRPFVGHQMWVTG